MKKHKIALAGATGLVGREVLKLLADPGFPAEITLLASSSSVGTILDFGNKRLVVEPLSAFDFAKTDLVIFCTPAEITGKYAWRATAKNAMVIDNSSYYENDADVPAIIPEINSEKLAAPRKNIIANMSGLSLMALPPLQALHEVAKIKRISGTVYLPASEGGKFAMDELYDQSVAILKGRDFKGTEAAFNIIPENENPALRKMKEDIQNFISPKIKFSLLAVNVPIFKGQAAAFNIEFAGPLEEKAAIAAMAKNSNIKISENAVTPLSAEGRNEIFISISKDVSLKNAINLWMAADNVRVKTLNTLKIAQGIVKKLDKNAKNN